MMVAPTRPGLTVKQQARRHRVIQAALVLGAEGGYEAVQMRDVAATANVALGTIYRYFACKDHLLAAAWAEWTEELQSRLAQRPPQGCNATDCLVDVLRRACRAIERQPRLMAALVKALGSPDPAVAREVLIVRDHVGMMSAGALEHLDPETREDVMAVIFHVWYSALVTWANGRAPIGYVGDELERAVRLAMGPDGFPVGGREASRVARRARATDRVEVGAVAVAGAVSSTP